jgi:hypothetical protein
MATTAKRKQLIERADRMMKGVERQLNPEKYMSDLIGALNYYNANHDDKDKKKWLISHLAKTDKKLAVELLKVDEYHFRYAGILARLMDGGSELQEKEANYFNDQLEKLKSQIGSRQKSQDKLDKKTADALAAAAPSNVISIQQRMEEKARELASEIDGAIDDFLINKKNDFSTKNYLLANLVAAPIAKRIGEMYIDTAAELREAIEGTDPQLVEGYSHFTKRELKKFAEFVDGIISDCNQQVQTAKANRAPRKRKEKPASVQVARMKYLKEFAELSLKSIKPEGIINSTEVWVYNTKYRRVGVYKADNGALAVKGTTILGFSVTESKQFTLRKPADFFKGLTIGKRPLNAKMKTLTTKSAVPNGRINEETIILGAF